VSWVVVVIGGFPRAVCRSWVPGSLCKWVLGLVCGRRCPSVGCRLESRVDVACSGATSAAWWWRCGLGTSAILDRRLVATSPTATWHLDAMLKWSVVGAGELAHLGSLPSVPVHACVLSCPHHRVIVVVVIVVIVPLVGHMVVPSSSCVSARWVGTNVGWGYSPWHPKVHNDDERQMSVIVRHLVATSPTATWHLDPMLERSVVGAGELLTSAHCRLVLFVHAGHHLWAAVVCFVFYGVGCGVTCVATFVVIGVCGGGWGGQTMVVGGGGDTRGWLLVVDVGGRNDGGGWETKVLFVEVFVSAVSGKCHLRGSV